MVSYPTWLHCVSSQQETFREWFPIRHGSIAFHTDRKLFANGFLSDMVPLRFIPTGNFSHIVFCPAWLHCVSSRQETFCEWFPIRHGSIAFHLNRKPFANGFLSGMAPLRFITAGNFFAYSFLSGMAPLRFIPAGNFSRMVSCPAWHHCVSSRQETLREWFPIRHGSIAFHLNRKLLANSFPSGMTPLCFIAAGNFFANGFLSGMAPLCFISAGNLSPVRHSAIAFHLHRKLFPNPCIIVNKPLRQRVGNLNIEVYVYGKESFP